jgi:hypothetical protein
MKIINSHKMDREDIFPCFSPPLAKFLVEIKGIEFIDIQFNQSTNKKSWIFAKSQKLDDALAEWKERKDNKNKIY